jgi:hypothetical protein
MGRGFFGSFGTLHSKVADCWSIHTMTRHQSRGGKGKSRRMCRIFGSPSSPRLVAPTRATGEAWEAETGFHNFYIDYEKHEVEEVEVAVRKKRLATSNEEILKEVKDWVSTQSTHAQEIPNISSRQKLTGLGKLWWVGLWKSTRRRTRPPFTPFTFLRGSLCSFVGRSLGSNSKSDLRENKECRRTKQNLLPTLQDQRISQSWWKMINRLQVWTRKMRRARFLLAL